MIDDNIIKTLGCGVHHGSMLDLIEFLPEQYIIPILEKFPKKDAIHSFTFDVKVHMLMPGQYPCIPNWHYDLVPRDENKKQLMDKRDPNHKLYLWLSGPPFTEFRDGRKVEPQMWTEFTQFDEHRGTPATEHCWRLFIRAAPTELLPIELNSERRHSQVYLDANNFTW